VTPEKRLTDEGRIDISWEPPQGPIELVILSGPDFREVFDLRQERGDEIPIHIVLSEN